MYRRYDGACVMKWEWWAVGLIAIRRGLRIDFNSSGNLVLMCRRCLYGGELAGD